MKSRIDPADVRAITAYATWLGGEAQAKMAEIGRHQQLATQTIDSSHLSAEWRALQQKRLGDDARLLSLLDRVAPINARVIESLSGRAEALHGAATSFLGLADALTEQRSGPITVTTARSHEQSQQLVLKRIDQIQKALVAAGDCDAVKIFPQAQLDRIGRLAGERIAQIHSVAELRCRRTLVESLRPADVARPADAARALADRLGTPALEANLLAAHERLKGRAKKSFAENLSAMALLADEAVNAPDYAHTKMGWHHPSARSLYRRRAHDAISRYQSQDRQEQSQRTLASGLQAVLHSDRPDRTLEQLLVQSFLFEIGVPSFAGKVEVSAIRRALQHEAFLPLRALVETAGDMWSDPALRPEITRAVSNIVAHVVAGDYRQWRYDNPVSRAQLSSMSSKQRDKWMADLRTQYRAGGLALRTREEDDIELLWLTKIGGPSHGFDYGGRCLLPLLSNGRTKAILVDDERYPTNAAARSYIRVLDLPDGSPTLYLEPFQRDFPHRDAFLEPELDAHLYAAVIAHAKQKADELGLPLSIGPEYRQLVDALGIAVKVVDEPLLLRASNGVFEASDTLGLGHDFPQQEDIPTPSLHRLQYRPKAR